MVDEILNEYGLKDYKVTPFGSGLINKTWKVSCNGEEYILQRVNDHVFRNPYAISGNIEKIGSYLSEHYPSYLFPVPVKSLSGQQMIFHEGKGYFRLLPFIKNTHTIDTVATAHQAFEAAGKFGEFTSLLSDFNATQLQDTIPHFHDLTLRFRQFTEALEKGNKERMSHSEELINYLLSQKDIADVYASIQLDPDFKIRVMHHDTKISNVLFNEEDRGVCVIDPDTIMPGYFISDVGDMMRTYLSPVSEEEKDFSKIEIREEYYKAIVDGYLQYMGAILTEKEKGYFVYAGKFMIYMQALRFLADYLNNDVYYGSKYEGHNLVRAGNQAELLKKLVEKEEQLMNR